MTTPVKMDPYEVYQKTLQNYMAKINGGAGYPAYSGGEVAAPAQPGGLTNGLAGKVMLGQQLANSGSALSSGGGAGLTAELGATSTPSGMVPSLTGMTAEGSSVAPTTLSEGVLANAGGMGVLPLTAIAGATYLGGKSAYDTIRGKEDKSIPGYIGRGTLAIATGGISEALRTAGVFHKSTKDIQKEEWGKLAGSAHAPTSNFANKYLEYLGSDQAKTDALYENTLEGKKAAGKLRPEDVWGGRGVLTTFGDDWLGKYSENQRRSISKDLISADLIGSSKGDQTIKDEGKAREIAKGTLARLLKEEKKK